MMHGSVCWSCIKQVLLRVPHEYLNHDASQLPKQESRRKRMYVMSLLIYDIFEVPYGGWIDEI